MLVLVKLVLPVSLSSPFSFGYFFGDKLVNIKVEASAVIEQHQAKGNIEIPARPSISQKINAAGNEIKSAEQPRIFSTPDAVQALPKPDASPRAVKEKMSPSEPITWQAAVFLIWLVGIFVLLVLLVQRLWFVKELIAQGDSANERLRAALDDCRSQMAIGKNIELKISHNTLSPAACGLFKPIVLMPASLLEKLSRQKLRAVLLHELAHIKRADLWVNFAQTILQIIYFYNPLLWLANAIIRRVREKAVDEMVLTKLGEDAPDYSNTLIDVAEMAFSRPLLSLRLIGVVESKKALTSRLKHILQRPFLKTAKLGLAGLLAIILAGAILLPMAKAGSSKNGFQVTEKIIGSWQGQAKVPDTWFNRVDLPISLTIKKDGTASGKIGDAEFYDGVLKKDKIARIGKQRLWGSEYVIEGKLRGAINAKEGIERKTVRVLLDYDEKENRLEGGTFSSGWALGGKKTGQVIGRHMELRRSDSPDNLLDTGEKETKGTEDKSEFKAILPNGVTVELVGICEHPSKGKQWWQPDGEQLGYEIQAVDGSSYSATEPGYQFVFKTSAATDHFKIENVKNSQVGSAFDVVKPEGSFAGYRAHIKAGVEKTDIKIGAVTAKWNTIAEHNGKGTNFGKVKSGKVIFSAANNIPDGVLITVTDNLGVKKAYRLVAIDKTGQQITGHLQTSLMVNGMRQQGFMINHVTTADLTAYEFQEAPYEWIEFKNVSLKPKVKTDVQIEVEKTVASNKEENAEKINRRMSGSDESLPNVFILSPPSDIGAGLHIFEEITYLLKDVVYNKTGRNHNKKSYDELFDGTYNRKPGDLLILVFSLDTKDRTPAEYQDILPQPWEEIETQLKQGQIVELQGKARDLNVVVIAAPKKQQLQSAISQSRLLKALVANLSAGKQKTQGKIDVAVEDFTIHPYEAGGLYTVTVKIRNLGSETAPAFRMNFYRGDPAENLNLHGKPQSGSHGAGPIKPDDTWNECSSPFALVEGENELAVVLDYDNQLDETNKSNNSAALNILFKDGQIREKSVSYPSQNKPDPDGQVEVIRSSTIESRDRKIIQSGSNKFEAAEEFTGAFAAGTKLSVENDNGVIKVTGTDRQECVIKTNISVKAATEEDAKKLMDKVKINVNPSGKDLVVKAERPNPGWRQSVKVDFEIAVPRQANLKLTTDNGAIEIADINGEIVGKTDNGTITAVGTDGNIRLETDNGWINIKKAHFAHGRFATDNGAISCENISGDIECSTDNGKVKVIYAGTASNVCNAVITTDNGDITFAAPANLSAVVKVQTDTGSIKTNLPLTLTGWKGKTASGTIGKGEGKVILKSSTGSITIS